MTSISGPTTDFVFSLLGPRPRVPDGVDWDEAVGVLRRHGLEGLAVATHRERGLLPGAVEERLEPAYLRTSLFSTLTLETARRAREVLAGAGIPSLLYKGAALLEDGTYPDPGGRRMDDADLLIRPEHADGAVRRLTEAGFEPWSPWEPGRVRWLDSVCLDDPATLSSGAGITVDLHWRVRYGGIRFGEKSGGAEILWTGADRDRGLPSPESHLVVLAEHVLKHLRVRTHLHGLADLARVAERIGDWGEVAEGLREHRSAAGVGALFDLLAAEVGAPLPPRASGLGAGSGSRRLVRRILDPSRLLARESPVEGRLRGLLFRWALSGSVGGIAREVAETVLPGEEWLRARYRRPEGSLLLLRLRYWRDLLRWAGSRGRSPVSPNQGLLE